MIRVLVTDDDYRVAHLHAASVDRVDGFGCVGEAHTAGETRELIRTTQPDLLILDVYLPDEDGLSLLRSLTATGTAPDCIIVTAARDLDAVRDAMKLGAIYYLVKPFGFHQFREQLESYRRWREQVGAPGEQADQATVDNLYSVLRGPAVSASARRRLPPTMAKILDAVTAAHEPLSASTVADLLGVSRPTAQRYLTELERRGLIQLELQYRATGRPVHRYRPATDHP